MPSRAARLESRCSLAGEGLERLARAPPVGDCELDLRGELSLVCSPGPSPYLSVAFFSLVLRSCNLTVRSSFCAAFSRSFVEVRPKVS